MHSPESKDQRSLEQEIEVPEEAAARVLEAARQRPIAMYHLIKDPNRFNTLSLYPNKTAVAAACNQLQVRKVDRLIRIGGGRATGKKTGRLLDVFYNSKASANGWPADNNLTHTLRETDFELAVTNTHPGVTVNRGHETGKRRADIVITREFPIPVEVDCGTMKEDRVLGRWSHWSDWDGIILVIIASRYESDQARMKRLIHWGAKATDFNNQAFYALLSDLITKPTERIFWDCAAQGFTLDELWKIPLFVPTEEL